MLPHTEKKKIIQLIDNKAHVFTEASDRIWGVPETRFDLKKSADILCEILKSEGFSVERGIAGMNHAFVATWGSGSPAIGILSEYDALSNLSQEADVIFKKAADEGGSGHGCGHNALGAGSLGAAIALKDYLSVNPCSATIRYFGCPAEESGSGKAFMARDGIFDGTDAMFTWHPWTETKIWGTSSLANYQVSFHFKGISSHAAASPEHGRSALDAAELMSIGVNYLREHIIQEARIHYAYTDAGGNSPNVVQPNASVLYFIRAPKSTQVKPIFERVVDIARGAALMSGTTMEIEWDSACSEYIVNDTLGRAMYENMKELGDHRYSNEEYAYAQKYVDTLPESAQKDVADMIRRSFAVSAEKSVEMASKSIQGELFPYEMGNGTLPGSTDVGDASWIAPTAQLLVASYPTGTPGHSWQWVATGKSPIIHKGLIYAAKVMAMTALDTIMDPGLIMRAKDEHKERLGGISYDCAIPKNVKPKSN